MKFLVTAMPKHVPLLDMASLQRTAAWHQANERLGCLMLVEQTGCLAGMLEAPSEAQLRQTLDSYPDKGCYEWKVQTVQPMSDACAQNMSARTAPRVARPMNPGMDGSIFPAWMTATPQRRARN